MSASFYHHHDHAVVTFSDELSWTTAIDLVDTVDTVVDNYFYRVVELLIASPGGKVVALDYLLNAFERWRAEGVHVRVRVISEVASAAAFLFALADERIAEPGASFSFHSVRMSGLDEVTAQSGAEIHAALSRVNDRFLARLVDRVLDGAEAPSTVPAGAEDADRPLLERLAAELALKTPRRSRSPTPLARAIGSTVTRAVRAGDRATLIRLYDCVCATECRISAPLARTLRLVDRIGSPVPPSHPGAAPRGLHIPHWRALFPPDGRIDRALLTRHVLVLGETGSGKTASAILPVLGGMAAAPPDVLGAGLVIDPKCEIAPILERIAPERVDRLTVSSMALDLMVGPRWSLEPDLAAGRWLSAARRILLRVVSFVPSSPARVLGEHEVSSGNAEFFEREGSELLLTALAFVLMVTHPSAPAPAEWLDGDDSAHAWVVALLERARGDASERGPNALALAAWVLDTAVAPNAKFVASGLIKLPVVRADDPPPPPSPSPPSSRRLSRLLDQFGERIEWPDPDPAPDPDSAYDPDLDCDLDFTSAPDPEPPPRYPSSLSHWLFARVAYCARKVWGAEPGEGQDVLERVIGYWADMVPIGPQFVGVRSSARIACSEIADPALARTLYFGCEPGYAAARAAGALRCDFATAVSRNGAGRLTVYQPARDGLDVLVAMALKALFFEAVLGDPDRLRGDPDVPLVAYVSDEFHRFATSDRVHGEQSFLDTCRSFNSFCVLACQSVSSIEHALSHGAGSHTRNSTAIAMLWNNTGTKLVFRTTDPRTGQRIDDLAPYRPGLAGVTRVRPVSTLATGECYAVLADGRFERRQLLPFTDVEEPSDD